MEKNQGIKAWLVLAGIVSVIALAIILIVNIVGKNTREKYTKELYEKSFSGISTEDDGYVGNWKKTYNYTIYFFTDNTCRLEYQETIRSKKKPFEKIKGEFSGLTWEVRGGVFDGYEVYVKGDMNWDAAKGATIKRYFQIDEYLDEIILKNTRGKYHDILFQLD